MEDRDDGGLPLYGIVIALLLLGAWVFQEVPLRPLRPASDPVGEQSTASLQDVPARLWEDPFEAVRRYRGGPEGGAGGGQSPAPTTEFSTLRILSATSGRPPGAGKRSPVQGGQIEIEAPDPVSVTDQAHCSDRLRLRIETLWETDDLERITIIGAMVVGGAYAEEKEKRLRARYSILSGLASSGFSPEQDAHIGYWYRALPGGGPPDPRQQIQTLIPYEWFDNSQGHRTLVLWLNDDFFGPDPLAKLAGLFRELRGLFTGLEDIVHYKILGPPGSSNLKRMVEELEAPSGLSKEARSALRDTDILSSRATVACSELFKNQSTPCNERLDRLYHAQTGGRFLRTIATDAILAKELVKELNLRGIDPACDKGNWASYPWCINWKDQRLHHVVLVSEWDTLFGRSLPRAFDQVLLSSGKDRDADRDLVVHRFTYVRGLDGLLPPPEKDQRSHEGRAAEKRQQPLYVLPPQEVAAGRSQFDYLRRMSQQVVDLDNELRHEGRGKIKAVGVLGSDFYDKLLILQALREKLPNITYFTTDLDARYLLRTKYKWTRNLVVASSFALRLGNDPVEERTIVTPSFRDSYQTATYFATKVALEPATNWLTQEFVDNRLQARIFETGRDRFFDLSPAAALEPDPCGQAPGSSACSRIYPQPWEFLLSLDTVRWVPVIILIGLALLYLTVPRVRFSVRSAYAGVQTGSSESGGQWRANAALVIVALLGLLAVGIVILSTAVANGEGEPFVPMAGVSIWPSEILRVVGGVLAIWLAFKGWQSLQRNDEQLRRTFDLPTYSDIEKALRKSGKDSSASPESAQKFSTSLSEWCQVVETNDDESEDIGPPTEEGGTRATGKHAKEPICAKDIWRQYELLAHGRCRFQRIFVRGALFYALALTMVYGLGDTIAPYRGQAAFWADLLIGNLFLGVPFLILLFGVVDETRLCGCTVKKLAASGVKWPKKCCRNLEKKLEDVPNKLINHWITARFIAERTDVVSRLIYYPFFVLILILLSLSTRFDNWDTPVGVIGIIALSIVVAFSSTLVLRSTARKARDQILERLALERLKNVAEENSGRRELVELLIEEIKGMKGGAFRHFLREPVVRAFIWVLGTAGLVGSEYFAISG